MKHVRLYSSPPFVLRTRHAADCQTAEHVKCTIDSMT